MLSRLRVSARIVIPLRFARTKPAVDLYRDPHSNPDSTKSLSLADIKESYDRIKDGIIRTDCKRSDYFSRIAGCEVYYKKESKQRTGSFKERGARNALLCLSVEDREKGVVVGSHGNYARAMAYHGNMLKVPITCVLPRYVTLRAISRCKEFGANVIVKRTGSFKERGARNALLCLSVEDREKGVVVGSHGNYARAMAYHGNMLKVPITCVLPRYVTLRAISRCKEFGANVIVKGKNVAEARKYAFDLAQEKGSHFIDGHDHIDVIAGAGTIALEIFEQLKEVDTILVPVGGGALLAGITTAVKEISPNTRIVGIETKASQCFTKALEKGKPVLVKSRTSLASSLAFPRAGYNSFNIVKDKVDIVSVKEHYIALAQLRMLEQHKIAVEGGGAVGFAALLSDQVKAKPGAKVVTILSGGNVDCTVLGHSIEKGLLADDRLVLVDVFMPDQAGAVCELLDITAKTGANVKDISMDHIFHHFGVFTIKLTYIAETRGREHSLELQRILSQRYQDDLVFYMKETKRAV
ncbi:unnamed protein product [Cylicocyclus nassatus]|uniref:L-serine deaminase n=1 Tax=Cylicocyclus nassatus TaxID=53992 RepID=A0AA36DQM6_CYLNA|nr:unnamed protein product [Cylicocyclus nassatus]